MKLVVVLMSAVFTMAASAASYHVPVPDSLLKANDYTPTKAEGSIVNGKLNVTYCLPTELVGDKAPTFTFTGNAGASDFVNVSGDDVYGVCMFSKAKPMTCMLKYPNLKPQIDEEVRDLAINKTFPADVVGNRLEVAKLFQENPAGLLTLDVTR